MSADSRRLALSPEVLAFAANHLGRHGLSLDDDKKLAEAVKTLSDWFIANPDGHTPWDEPWAQHAYLAYYLPLNELRARAVVREGEAVGFFTGLDRVVDFGAGPGTACFALKSSANSWSDFRLVERSRVPASLFSSDSPFRFQTAWNPDLHRDDRRTLFVASYSLTEGELPKQAMNFEALMLIEPSTQDDGRRLLELRRRLLAEGYFAWAPCPHQLGCPLLEQSKRDWCHDRVHVERPEWLRRLEDRLPFRNQTVTFSYLLARRTPPAPPQGSRLVSDRLEEKGKDRQLICRGPEREFLTWMHKKGLRQELPRGERVREPLPATKVANEWRLETAAEVLPSALVPDVALSPRTL